MLRGISIPSGTSRYPVRALALIEEPGHSSARFRLAAYAPALAEVGCALHFATLPRSALARIRLFAKLPAFATVIMQRRLMPSYQVRFLRSRSRRLIFDFDDAIFGRDSYHRKGFDWPQRERRFKSIVKAADMVIAGNGFLRDHAVASGARRDSVIVIPTCVDPPRYTLAEHHPRDGIDLVWTGSSSTLQGLELNQAMFTEIAARIPKLRLRIICDRFPAFTAPPIIRKVWSEHSEGPDLVAGDIGISWIPDDRWSRGKCGFKVLQYYAAGLPVIANSVGVHPEMIRSGVTGFLADSTEEWIRAITQLADPERRRQMGAAARQFVTRKYSVPSYAEIFAEIVTDQRPINPPGVGAIQNRGPEAS